MTPSQTAHPTEGERRPASLSFEVGQTIQRWGHEWKVCGIHLGGLKSESLIELAQVSPEAGWTGPWEFHPQLFIPEVLLSAALLVRPQGEEGLREAEKAATEANRDLRSALWQTLYPKFFLNKKALAEALDVMLPVFNAYATAQAVHAVFGRAALSNQGKPSS